MLIVGYCYSIRSERRLCQEVKMNLAYRWFCGLGLEDKVPHHSTFSVNRHGRFRDSDILRKVFEEVVCGCMTAGLVGGEGFAVDAAVDASVIEADASRFQKRRGVRGRLDTRAARQPSGPGVPGRAGKREPADQPEAKAQGPVADRSLCRLDDAGASQGDVRL